MLLLGHYILGEEVGRRRILACCAGFFGTLLVIQPSFAEVGWPALLPLGVAVDFALFILVTRQVAKSIDPVALQTISGAMAMVILVPLLILAAPFGIKGLTVIQPTSGDILLLLALGVLGTVAHLVMTWSLRFAPSATLAPVQYFEIPMAALIGWLVFRDFPNGLALFGICITISAGLYILLRERAISRQARATPDQAPPAAE